MNWTRAIDAYCERTHAGLFAEPLNAWSNVAFVLAAWLVWRAGDGLPRGRGAVRLLAGLLVGIGAGSFAFHTWAVVLTAMLDVLFIALFVLAFVVIFLRLAAGWALWQAGAGAALVVAATAAVPRLCAGASCVYLPAWVALVACALLATRRGSPAARPLALAGALFVPSIVLRSLDLRLCDVFPLGTHFLWHLLNAAVLALAATALATHLRALPRRVANAAGQ